ncbi:MAG: HAD family hydrolase [Aureliella sp.]
MLPADMTTEKQIDNPNVTVVLFDIDGTMINSSGAGGSALLMALEAEFSVASPLAVELHGRTDSGIFRELLEVNGVEPTNENYRRLCLRYFNMLPGVLETRETEPLVGVRKLVEGMDAGSQFALGLLTGNLPESAKMKLEHFGLAHYFAAGTFGDAARHRPGLRDSALATARKLAGGTVEKKRIVVVGDTPLDIELAKVMQVRCLAVATGGYSAADLSEAGADRALDDLTDTADVMQWCLS